MDNHTPHSDAGGFWPDTHASWLEDLQRPERRTAVLNEMAAAYRLPLLRTVRGALPRLDPAEAEDLVQQFFSDDVFPRGTEGTTLFDKRDPARGLLRNLLRTSLRNFIASWLRARNTLKRGGTLDRVEMDQVDDESGGEYLPHGMDPFFDREWALHVFSGAFKKIEEHYLADPERARRYHVLKPWLLGYDDDERLTQHAATLGVEDSTIRQFILRLRKAWQKAVRDLIAPTVAGPEQVEEELRYLCEVLRRA